MIQWPDLVDILKMEKLEPSLVVELWAEFVAKRMVQTRCGLLLLNVLRSIS